MAYVSPNGRVRLRAFSRPVPRYDFEPSFVGEPDGEALRQQAVDLISRAICMADGDGLALEEGSAVDERWCQDWGQRIASGTHKEEVARLLADVPSEYIAKILLRAFYRSVLEILALGEDSLTCLMGVHAMDGLVTDSVPEPESMSLCFSMGDEISQGKEPDEGESPSDATSDATSDADE